MSDLPGPDEGAALSALTLAALGNRDPAAVNDIRSSTNAADLRERFAALVNSWYFCVAQFEQTGADPATFRHDIWPRDLLMLLLVERRPLFDEGLLARLAEIDRRFYAIEHRYPPGHPAGTTAPRPDDLTRGRWWAVSMPMPRMRTVGTDPVYDALRHLAFELAGFVAPVVERLLPPDGDAEETVMDFVLEWISPAALRPSHELLLQAGCEYLRERARELGLQPEAARISVVRHAYFGLLVNASLSDAASSHRFEAPLVRREDGRLRWLWPTAAATPA